MPKIGHNLEHASAEELSRLRDALEALAGTRFHSDVWNGLPHGVKFDYNWGRWEYAPRG